MTTLTTTMVGKRVLVAEDEYFIAKSLVDDLQGIGADVLGPVATIADALALIAAEPLDAAVLDINLRGEMAYAVADALIKRGIPVVLATGYSSSALPSRYSNVLRCDKPVDVDRLAAKLFPG